MAYKLESLSGKHVAELLIDRYLNNYCSNHEPFMAAMSKERKEAQENFSYLAFAWLKGLNETRYYDMRNEASVLLAWDVFSHIKEAPVLHAISGEEAMEAELDPYDDIQVERVMADYLEAGSTNAYQEFIDYALQSHRTLQQNLTRFFMEWLQREKKNSLFIQNASIVLEKHELPYI